MVCPRAEPAAEPSNRAPIAVAVRALRTVRRFMSTPLWLPEADAMGGEKVSHRFGDVDHVSLESKVSRIEELDRRVREVFSKCFGARRDEEGIVLAPDGEERRRRLTKVLVKRRIQLHIRGVVEEQIQLDLLVPPALQESGVQRVRFGRHR